MNSLESHGSSYFEVRMSFLISSNFGYYESKTQMEKRLDIYELMVEESLLAWHSKAFIMREISILAIWPHINTKRTV